MISRFKPGKKRCKNCNNEFEKNINQPFQICCTVKCAIEYVRKQADKKELKHQRSEVKELKEKTKTPSEYRNELQAVFNQYIKLRDADLPCISCDTCKPTIRYDAGHFFSVGAYPNLRFNEDNVHKQCSFNCNNKKHGNHAEYSIRLIKRISQQRYDALIELRNQPLQLNKDEIKLLIKSYKLKIKLLKQKQ